MGSATTVTAPPPASLATFLIDEGLAAPIDVDGEPERHMDDPVNGNFDTVHFTLRVELPAGWQSRGLMFASWTPGIGFHEFYSDSLFIDGVGEISSRTHGPDFIYELWLMEQEEMVPMRRLVELETAPLDGPLRVRFAPGFETVNDVMTKPPPPGGNYLIPVDSP